MQSNLIEKPILHIVCLNNPYPPDYGGVIDIYYKIKALHEIGVNITLHCFIYDRQPSPKLQEICNTVYYYKRKRTLKDFISTTPFIVKSRNNKQLLKNLMNDNYPILLEGIHCTALIEKLNKNGRFVGVRTHNIEHDYYNLLSKVTHSIIQKIFLKTEAVKLKHYEKVLKQATQIFAISNEDQQYFNKKYTKSTLLPVFHPYKQPISKTGRGTYILIHGNLSIKENEESIIYLIKRVISEISYPIIISGKNPTRKLINTISQHENIKLISSPEDKEMIELQQNAQIILLHSHQATGIKLKLINSLYIGRHIICNKNISSGSSLEKLCQIADTPKEWIKAVDQLWETDFTNHTINQRAITLNQIYNPENNAIKLKAVIFNNKNN